VQDFKDVLALAARLERERDVRTRQVERWQHAAHGGCSSDPDGALLCAPASPGDFARAVHERDAALTRLQTAESALALLRPTCDGAIKGQQEAHQYATDMLARVRASERLLAAVQHENAELKRYIPDGTPLQSDDYTRGEAHGIAQAEVHWTKKLRVCEAKLAVRTKALEVVRAELRFAPKSSRTSPARMGLEVENALASDAGTALDEAIVDLLRIAERVNGALTDEEVQEAWRAWQEVLMRPVLMPWRPRKNKETHERPA